MIDSRARQTGRGAGVGTVWVLRIQRERRPPPLPRERGFGGHLPTLTTSLPDTSRFFALSSVAQAVSSLPSRLAAGPRSMSNINRRTTAEKSTPRAFVRPPELRRRATEPASLGRRGGHAWRRRAVLTPCARSLRQGQGRCCSSVRDRCGEEEQQGCCEELTVYFRTGACLWWVAVSTITYYWVKRGIDNNRLEFTRPENRNSRILTCTSPGSVVARSSRAPS